MYMQLAKAHIMSLICIILGKCVVHGALCMQVQQIYACIFDVCICYIVTCMYIPIQNLAASNCNENQDI